MFIDPSDFDSDLFASPENIVLAAWRKIKQETAPDRLNAFGIEIKEYLTVAQL